MKFLISSFYVLIYMSTDHAVGRLEELKPLVPLMSEKLYDSIFREKNSSLLIDRRGYQPLNPTDIQNARRWNLWLMQIFLPGESVESYANYRMCHLISVVQQGALHYIHRYYDIRTSYVNDSEFELGYLSHQIVDKYSLMLETYQIIVFKFIEWPNRMYMPMPAMFYFYTIMLEHAQVITHLLAMVNELGPKYEGVINHIWDEPTTTTEKILLAMDSDDSGENTTKRFGTTTTTTTEPPLSQQDMAAMYEQKRLLAAKKRKKELRKKRKLMERGRLQTRYPPTPPTYSWTHRGKSHWDLDYGWSIEQW